jgi:hypothetical protein
VETNGEPPDGPGTILLALLTTPGVAGTLAEAMARDLGAELDGLLPGARWQVVTPPSVGIDSPAEITDVLDLARSQLLEGGADLAVLLTDLPLKLGRRPVLGHASPVHGVAVVSLPALGAVQLRNRSRRAVLWTVQALVGAVEKGTFHRSVEGNAADGSRHRRRARRAVPRVRQLARDMDPGDGGVVFVVRTGHVGHLELGRSLGIRAPRVVERRIAGGPHRHDHRHG